MSGSSDQSAEEVVAKNVANGTTEKLENEANTKFTKEFLDSVRSDKSRHLYPERGGGKSKPSWTDIAIFGKGREPLEKLKCERKVYDILKNSPLVKIMTSALNAAGCPLDIRRHISCETCNMAVAGGYDPFLNQVVVCQNTASNAGVIQETLAHEMIHMYDFCKRKLDLNNNRHLACTEIRAANLTYCSFLTAVSDRTASFFNIKQQHQECVRKRAVASVMAVKDISVEEAYEVVDSVFDKCYADLEPIGRRIRRNSDNVEKAYLNRLSY